MMQGAVLLCVLFVAGLLVISVEEAVKLGTVIGIDLGTTYSCVAVYKNGQVKIIANDQRNCITPSWVAFTENERLIEEAAKNQATVNPDRTVFDVKRLIGRKFEDKEVEILQQHHQPLLQESQPSGQSWITHNTWTN